MSETVLHADLLYTIVWFIVYNMEQVFNVYNKSVHVHGDLSSSGARGCAIFFTAL
jgi:hypothetical protein